MVSVHTLFYLRDLIVYVTHVTNPICLQRYLRVFSPWIKSEPLNPVRVVPPEGSPPPSSLLRPFSSSIIRPLPTSLRLPPTTPLFLSPPSTSLHVSTMTLCAIPYSSYLRSLLRLRRLFLKRGVLVYEPEVGKSLRPWW